MQITQSPTLTCAALAIPLPMALIPGETPRPIPGETPLPATLLPNVAAPFLLVPVEALAGGRRLARVDPVLAVVAPVTPARVRTVLAPDEELAVELLDALAVDNTPDPDVDLARAARVPVALVGFADGLNGAPADGFRVAMVL